MSTTATSFAKKTKILDNVAIKYIIWDTAG